LAGSSRRLKAEWAAPYVSVGRKFVADEPFCLNETIERLRPTEMLRLFTVLPGSSPAATMVTERAPASMDASAPNRSNVKDIVSHLGSHTSISGA
jgi:hypothetical protein